MTSPLGAQFQYNTGENDSTVWPGREELVGGVMGGACDSGDYVILAS